MKTNKELYIDINKPILKTAIEVQELIRLLSKVAEKMFPVNGRKGGNKQIYFRQCKVAIDNFGNFLKDRKSVNPDEHLIEEFDEYLCVFKPSWAKGTRGKYISQLKNILNLLPSEMLERKLVCQNTHKKMKRFDNFNTESKSLILEYLKDGRNIKLSGMGARPTLAVELMTERSRMVAVESLQMIIKELKTNDILSLSEKDMDYFLELYRSKGKGETGIRYLVQSTSIYKNLWAKGIIDHYPLGKYRSKKYNTNKDYVDVSEIERLSNYGNAELADFYQVRDRLLCYGLLYDFGLRRGEAVLIDIDDISIVKEGGKEFVKLIVRKDVQKGKDCKGVELYNLFDNTLILFKAYKSLRCLQNLKSNALIINGKGRRYSDSGLSHSVTKFCNSVQIKTNAGLPITPHRLRHALGTLNIEPLGANLSLYYLSQRMRHHSIKTTENEYISNNKVLALESHKNIVDRSDKTIIEPASSRGGEVIDEWKALDTLEDFNITPKGLAKAARKDGALLIKNGKKFYNNDYIRDLAAYWIEKNAACSVFNITGSQYWYLCSKKKLRSKVIGKVSLVRKADLKKYQKAS